MGDETCQKMRKMMFNPAPSTIRHVWVHSLYILTSTIEFGDPEKC